MIDILANVSKHTCIYKLIQPMLWNWNAWLNIQTITWMSNVQSLNTINIAYIYIQCLICTLLHMVSNDLCTAG